MRTLSELQKLVGEWSHDNFGEQASKTFAYEVVYYEHNTDAPKSVTVEQRLGSLAPLLGIGEEIGELIDAESQEQRDDAIADVVIYLCDFTAREGMSDIKFIGEWTTMFRVGSFETQLLGISSTYFKLEHAVLKRHQGIRGYDDREKYERERDVLLNQLFCQLDMLAGDRENGRTEGTSLRLANRTFDEIVAKRNWKSKPKDADKRETLADSDEPRKTNKYEGKPGHAAAGWHPDQDGHG